MKEYHIGIVTRNIQKASGSTTPEQTAKVSSQELVGAIYFKAETLYDGEYPIPALPSFDFVSQNSSGFFWVPKVGDTLVIEMDISVDLPNPTYVSCLYTKDNPLHRDFKKHYPWRMGWITNSGHRLIFDDMASEETVRLEHKFGQYLFFDKDGSIELFGRKVTKRDETDEEKDEFEKDWFKFKLDRTAKILTYRYEYVEAEYGQLLIDGNTKLITLDDHHGNKIELDADKVKLTDKAGNTITMESAKITIDSIADVLVNSAGKAEVISGGDAKVEATGKCEVKGSTIELNGNVSEVTSKQSHQGVIDLITGAPIIASTTVFMDA